MKHRHTRVRAILLLNHQLGGEVSLTGSRLAMSMTRGVVAVVTRVAATLPMTESARDDCAASCTSLPTRLVDATVGFLHQQQETTHTHTLSVWATSQYYVCTTTILRPCFRDHPGEPVPEENLWTLWCKGRLTKADTPSDWAPLHPD